MDFNGKRILVTGGGAGIGRCLALRLASMGAHVFAISRTQATLDSLKQECPTITVRSVDLAKWDATREAIKEFLPLDMVVNNAGQCITAEAINASEADIDSMFNVNVKAATNIMQVVAHDLISREKHGSFVNVSSTDSKRPFKGNSAYSATKAALDMMTRSFALELGPHGIRVNAVNPTLVDTAMGQEFSESSEVMDYLLAHTPRGKVYALKDDIVNAIVFLLSDGSDMITGHCLPVDGGYLAI